MGDLWLKIKMWTKISVAALLVLAVLVFIFQNVNKPVTVWLWNEYPTTLLKVVFFTAIISIALTALVWTTIKTLRQFRNLRLQARTVRLEREMADMKNKASMLQTKPSRPWEAAGGTSAPPGPAEQYMDREP